MVPDQHLLPLWNDRAGCIRGGIAGNKKSSPEVGEPEAKGRIPFLES
jgi:hypothetical protein